MQVVIINSNLMLYYLFRVRPYLDNFYNHLEIFNEICILIASYHLLGFTDFVEDPQIKYNMGWSIIIISLLNITVNILIIIWSGLVTAKNVFIRIKRKWCNQRNITTAKKYQQPIPSITSSPISLDGNQLKSPPHLTT